MQSEIALCYFPTQIALVDDNANFLLALSMSLQEKFPCCTFEDPQAALSYANNRGTPMLASQNKSEHFTHDELEDIVQLTFNLPAFLRSRQDRYEELSVVIVDYLMPDMNGLEFCRRIKNPNIKKILLTSEISGSEVIDAFNDGVIDYYLSKGKKNLAEELNKAISRLQQEYFRDISRQLKTRALDGPNAIFSDPALCQHFSGVCEEYDVREYYFVMNPKRYILHTSSGQELSMLILTKDELSKHIQIMEEEGAPEDLVAKLKSEKYIPYFPSNDGYYDPDLVYLDSWLLKATAVRGTEQYYCAIYSDTIVLHDQLPIANLVATFH